MKNRVKLVIGGSEYVISSDEEESYVLEIGEEVERHMATVMAANPHISTTMASTLCALDYCDAARKAGESSDNLRLQMKDYIEDNARLRMESDEQKRALLEIKREVQALTAQAAAARNGARYEGPDKPGQTSFGNYRPKY